MPMSGFGVSRVLGSFMYFPSRGLKQTPAAVGLPFHDVRFAARDGCPLHGWWLPAAGEPSLGHILFCHGNAGNIGDRLFEAMVLTRAGFDVLMFDYRGYGHSGGRPDEPGTYRDARAARQALLDQPDTDPARVIYIGESLGGAIALALAVESPPAGLVLQSAFTSIRAMARHHYPFVPAALVPDWYPSLTAIPGLRTRLLVLHGERDEIVPLGQGQALYDAAPEPKRMHVFEACGHNDLVVRCGAEYGAVIAGWAREFAVSAR
jgi:fermentation-respiration switch protein FrsA (DUF1100 family)